MKKIVVITYKEKNPYSGLVEHIVSHGVDLETNKLVVLPQVPVDQLGVLYDTKMGEFILNETH